MVWKVDPSRSKIDFKIKHLRLMTVSGKCQPFEGALDMNEQDPEASSVRGSVDADGINTGFGLRDRSLRSLFKVKSYPKVSFSSTRVGPMKGDRFQVFGNVTIRGVTRPAVFEVVNKGELPTANGHRRWAFEATTRLRRKDFGLRWNPLIELANILVGDDVHGVCTMEFVQE